jgi:demethylmenaquinone methyltransferase/2-methoxy-6-polyprenyl-1,4-benzoquinol methylase
VLDVCCGTGDLAGEFRRDPRVRRVLGVDFVQAMVSRARNKFGSTAAGLEFAVGDAQQLPVGGGGFDVISIAFGLRNLTRPEGGLEGMAQLLRPGGRLVVLEFFRPRRGWWASAFRWYFRRVLPVIGRALSGTRVDAYRYLPESVEHFADPETVCDWTKRAGLINARIRPLTLGAVSLIVAERPSTEDPPDLRERWEETAVRDEDSKARSHRVSQDTSQWEYVPCST